ncbi:MAG: signal peptidase II [Parcubacteria group bacterium]|nr:signal peptidase II [Parcubacteria group bacterium]
MRSRSAITTLAVLGFALDRALKQYALGSPALGRGVFVFDSAFGLRLSLNEFFAWSLPVPNAAVLWIMVPAIAVLGAALYTKRAHPSAAGPLGLVAIGALSNAIDRLFYGGVVDYLAVPFGGAFNIADALVVLGAALLAVPGKRYAH